MSQQPLDQIPEQRGEPLVHEPARRWFGHRMVLVAAAGVVIAIALGVLFAAGVFTGPGTMTAHGTDIVFADPLDGQNVQAAYPDITDGAQVTVVNASGTVLGTGTLNSNPAATAQALRSAVAGFSGLPAADFASFVAEYDFTVRVPAGLPRYGIRVGQNRGTIWFSERQMRQGPGLSLGSLSG